MVYIHRDAYVQMQAFSKYVAEWHWQYKCFYCELNQFHKIPPVKKQGPADGKSCELDCFCLEAIKVTSLRQVHTTSSGLLHFSFPSPNILRNNMNK